MKKKQKILSIVSAAVVATTAITTTFPVIGYAQEDNKIIRNVVKKTELSGNCGSEENKKSVTWKAVKNGTNEDGEDTYILEISGSGEIRDLKNTEEQPWRNLDINKVVINEGITRIGDFSFDRVKYKEIELPSTLKEIGSWGICNESVENYNIAASNKNFSTDNYGVLYNVGKTHLYGYPGGKDAVDEYTIPDSVEIVEDGALSNAKIDKLVYGKNVSSMGNWQACTAKEVYIEDGKNEFKFGKGGFGQFKSLEKITLNRVKTIPGASSDTGGAFTGLNNLKEVNFAEGLVEIGNQAFLGTNIEELVFPDSLETIGPNAFSIGEDREPKLKKVVYGSGIKNIGERYGARPFANQNNIKIIDLTKVDEKLFPAGWDNGAEENQKYFNFNNVYPGHESNGISFYLKNKDYAAAAKGNLEWENANTTHKYFIFDGATVSEYPYSENEMPISHKQDEYYDGWYEYNKDNDSFGDSVITSLDQAKDDNVFRMKWKESKYVLDKEELDFGNYTYGDIVASKEINVKEKNSEDNSEAKIKSVKVSDEDLFNVEIDKENASKVIITPKSNINVGEYEEVLTITTEGGSEHNATLKININKALPTYTVPTKLTGKLGNQIETVILPNGFEWENGNEVLLKEGENKFIARYNPDDMHNYEVIEDIEITINVKKDTPVKPQEPSIPSVPSKPSKPTYIHEKIEGLDRYDTASKIADKLESYDTAVLVNATSTMSDGLSAAGLAGKEDAAVFLVKKDSIPQATMDRLKKVKKVYIIGGENAISKKVESEITKNIAKVEIERLGGKNRVETSELVAKEIGNYSNAFIVNGFNGEADAMSVSPVAAKYEAPILLTNGKTSTHAKKTDVKYYVIGGNKVVSNEVASKYNAERLAGDDRYETNRKVLSKFYSGSDKLYIANGKTLVDALTASNLAKNNGIVLVNEKSDNSILKDKNTVQAGGMDFEVDFE